MTPKQLKAMKLALEALELLTDTEQTYAAIDYGDNAITALREALAEHAMRETQRLGQEIEQEPVCPDCKAKVLYECVACSSNNYPPQRTEQEPAGWEVGVVDGVVTRRLAPPQRKPLTDEQIFALENSIPDEVVSDRDWCIHFARAIEAKIKEKNICQDQNQK